MRRTERNPAEAGERFSHTYECAVAVGDTFRV